MVRCSPGFHLQGVVPIPVADKPFGIVPEETDCPQPLPLLYVGQFVSQEVKGEGHTPPEEDISAPDLCLGPTGKEPGDTDEADAPGKSGRSARNMGEVVEQLHENKVTSLTLPPSLAFAPASVEQGIRDIRKNEPVALNLGSGDCALSNAVCQPQQGTITRCLGGLGCFWPTCWAIPAITQDEPLGSACPRDQL